jgi:flagellar basal-body rod protein FlgC
MSLFGSIDIAATGVTTEQTWLDTIASNVANANDVSAPNQPIYQEQEVLVQPVETAPVPGAVNATTSPLGAGVRVDAIVTPLPNGQLAYDPTSVLANAQGYVKTPGISLAAQLGNLVNAQSSYQANVAVINQAKAAYEAILGIQA